MSESDSGTDQAAGSEGAKNSEKVNRARKFHEASGGFDDVLKALAILIILGIIVYVVFLL